MKILYIDQQSIQNSVRIGLMGQMTNHTIDLVDDLFKALEYFKKESPEVVICDPTLAFSLEAMKQIFLLSPKQKCISLSDEIDCSDINGCETCLLLHRRRALHKEQGLHDLLYMIDNFCEMPCEYICNSA